MDVEMRRFRGIVAGIFGILSTQLALNAGTNKFYQYIHPAPNSKLVPYQSTIIIRLDRTSPDELSNLQSFINVSGRMSGEVTGATNVASDHTTIIFKPRSDFYPGDTITVTLNPLLNPPNRGSIEPIMYEFTVSKRRHGLSEFETGDECLETGTNHARLAKTAVVGQPMIMPNGVSVPSDFPHVNITINDNPADGYIFLNNWRDIHPYNLILDNTGSPIWYMRTPDGDRRRDFKVQRNDNLTMLVRKGYPFGMGFISLDHNYNEIDSFHAVDGYATDEHELQVLDDGHYLLIGLRTEQVDMSKYVSGGRMNANVHESIIQEFTPAHEKIFEWRAWDHFDIRDVQLEDLRGSDIRFPHMNAIEIDHDGHILLSSRHLSEVTKIHRQTGEIIWRLGGAHNQFTFVNDPLNGFYSQHDIRSHGNGHYTLFDNGNLHNPPVSRGVEYVLDTENMTATLVWEYRNPPGTSYSYYMGNAQRLPNGNTLINWAVGDRPKATEVRPDGKVAFEMNFVEQYHCYRVFRFPWDGMAKVPNLFVEPTSSKVTLIFNKFGDPDVDYYRIYGGTSAHPTTVMDTSKATMKHLANFQNDRRYYFRVTAVAKSGKESDFSEEKNAVVRFIEPGQNMLVNGDFSAGKASWTWELQGGAVAVWRIENGVSHFDIQNGGTQIYNVQLRQNGFELVRGEEYVFEFEAWADSPRIIEAKVGQDQAPWINYSKIGLTAVTQQRKRFAYPFKMEEPSDYNARAVFNCGSSNIDVYIDDISLKWLGGTAVEDRQFQAPSGFEVNGNYPNPFNAQTTIQFTVAAQSVVESELYNVLGELIKRISHGVFDTGTHTVNFDAAELTSGIYFYRIMAKTVRGATTFSDVHKMVLIR